MKLQKAYTALLTKDLVSAEVWYTKLFGRGPDFRPMNTLVQWDLSRHGGLQLASDDSLAGHGTLSLVVDDMEFERERLNMLGILLSDNMQGAYSILAKVRDLDQNLIVLATPPSPSYPKA